jgi:hypothetical protein
MMMNKVEGHPLPCISPSGITFLSSIDENDFKSKSVWNPDWTIQREISITIEYTHFYYKFLFNFSFFSKSINDSPKFCSKKVQILSGIAICIALILSVLIPIMISTIYPT